MTDDSTVLAEHDEARPIAHWSHTLALVVALAVNAYLGRERSAAFLAGGAHAPRYVGMITSEWLLLGAVIAGIYSRRVFFMRSLRGAMPAARLVVPLALAVYAATFLAIGAVAGIVHLTHRFDTSAPSVALAMMPRSLLELALWLVLSVSAGVCEEFTFRGYLQRQVTAWTGRPVIAIVITAVVFAVVHLYQGWASVLPIVALALVYGFVVRYFKGDLRVVMVAHVMQDSLYGIFNFVAPYVHHMRRGG